MSSTILFLLMAAVLVLIGVGIWRYWAGLVEVSPEEEELDRRMAALNERQAHRLTDDQLTHPPSDDDAWALIVRRGRRLMRRARYGGDSQRRARDRRPRER